ncbi:uncharacterized protein BXIN_1821 [Babesia sp. Xinjiang]|uniref:uncharacterized protein n=1 Tax=Babesia sp. Xinjiang TaxID=462227 RepID=UPI000A261B1E|nr:uncharacterized protein BXIN_1821 [Babesia sp. Xinjiang]ORM41967.1 hypothetical protein BXIN_1821 [Babesia sp. Xinjiang]
MAESCGCKGGGNGQHTSLLCPPGNLKECIDWILRLTGKDNGQNGGDKSGDLATAVKDLLGNGVETYIDTLKTKVDEYYKGVIDSAADKKAKEELEKAQTKATDKLTNDKKVLQKVNEQLNGSNGQLITNLATKLEKFIDKSGGTGIGNKGTSYTSSYNSAAKWNEQCEKDNLCARIFLGALPVIFSGLSYLYWRCSGNGRATAGERWTNQSINSTNALGIYFVCCGYKKEDLKSDKTANDIKSLLKDLFNNGTVNGDYSKYIKEVLTNTTSPDTYPLSTLYLASQYYFQYKFNNAGTHVPTTIREMLYWLMALPYSECFQLAPATIQQGIKKHGICDTPDDESDFIDDGITLKPTDPLDCLILTSCHYAAVVLSTIQGTICDNTTPKSPKGLHDIYSNSAFNFEYPTTANALFPVLWDIVSAVYSQIYFLMWQCLNCPYNGGWKYCKYGEGIQYDNVKSWICTSPGGQQTASSHNCNTDNCATKHTNCGKTSDNLSPLQAFLCDYLTPFQCESLKNNECQIQNVQLVSKNGGTTVPYSDHASHRNFNQYCPVPMGFNKDCLSHTERTGNYIHWILHYFTQKDRESVSLYNITLCLLIVCQRTPRTVGDLFAFFLYLGGIMNNGSSPNVADAINTEAENIPWNYKGSKDITTAVKTLAGSETDHPDASDSDEDVTSHEPGEKVSLHSLYNSECKTPQTCGQYLDPLSFVIYPIISESFAMSYLSRIVYLTDVLKEGLEELLKRFKDIQCKKDHGCKTDCDHGNENNCICPTIVQCADVLPLFFKYGFTYYSAAALNGTDGDPTKKRQCNNFYTQLHNVINNSFEPLLTQINIFLYHIRKPFLYYLLTFWLLVITYLTYSLTVPLDVLHLRSHLRNAVISPLVLLTNYTQRHDITYFKP